METGSNQHLILIENAHCDWRGQITIDAGANPFYGDDNVIHAIHFDQNELVYAHQDQATVYYQSTRDHSYTTEYDLDAVISSTVFNRNVVLASKNSIPIIYDGTVFRETASAAARVFRPSFVTTVQRRLCATGITGSETEVHISRVDDPDVFPADEAADETSVTRAGIIDISNILGTAASITGIAQFEQDRLAIFTPDRAIIYTIDPDIDQWAIDRSTNIHVGCLSHNTIAAAGEDLIFCSRAGIQTIRRSRENGIFVSSLSLSDKIDRKYRALLASIEDPQTISAVYDKDNAQYHVFFPNPNTSVTTRLTLTLNPEAEGAASFSTGNFLNARCGADLAGQTIFGTPGGLWEVANPEDTDVFARPEATFELPFLYHGSMTDDKLAHSVLIQAVGSGIVEVECIDIHGAVICSDRFDINDVTDDTLVPDMPLSQQYERPWGRRYLAAKYRFRITSASGLTQIIGFAINIRNER